MQRRDFIPLSALAGLGLSIPMSSMLSSCSANHTHFAEFRKLTFDLLKDWCDGMIKIQVINPSDSKVHGMLECPACEVVHARLMDAVYPFLYMAKEHYLKITGIILNRITILIRQNLSIPR